MTMTAAETAIFIRQEFRYEGAEDSVIKGRFIGAREIETTTNLVGATAKACAIEYLQAYGVPAMAFDIEIDGVLTQEDFIPAPPQYRVTVQDYCTDRVMRVVSYDNDRFKRTSTVTVMG